MLERFLTSNSMRARLGRTVLECALGVLVSAVAVFAMGMDAEVGPLLTAAVTAVASPVIYALGGRDPEDAKTDVDKALKGGSRG